MGNIIHSKSVFKDIAADYTESFSRIYCERCQDDMQIDGVRLAQCRLRIQR